MSDITLGDMLVTLVEPSDVQQRIIHRYLEQIGVQKVQTANSGGAALDQMHRHPTELVISAMHLPDMTGTDLVHTMRADEALKEIAFLLVSSETNIRLLDPIRQAGAIAILPKPFALVDLKRALNATLEYYTPSEANLGSYDIESLQVLIVDDSRMARNHIRRLLANMGIEHFAEAENGRYAIELIEQNFYDLVVTDYNMPEVDGNELTTYIREHSTQRSIPILMVTSEHDSKRLAAVEQAGVSAICDKPFETASVRTLLKGFFAE